MKLEEIKMDINIEKNIPSETLRVLKDKRLWDKIVFEEFDKKIVREYEAREIIFLCAMGSLVENCANSSFNLLVHSESSAGKDYTTKSVLKIIPQGTLFTRTRISPTVLNYWKPYKKAGLAGWDGCVLYLPDISEPVLNSDAFKLMCSDGSHITITDKGEAKDIEIKGKPVMFTTTAMSSPNEELMNRFSIIHLDESEEQTKAIMMMQAKRMMQGESLDYNPEIVKALNQLRRYPVKIPFADKIVEVFPYKRIGERRNFERFFDYMKAVTLVHQFQRVFDGDCLVATEEDYDKARDVFMNIQRGVSSLPLNRRQKDIVEVLKKSEDMLSAAEIHGRLRNYLALTNIRPHINSLVNLRIIDKQNTQDSLGREIIKYNLSEEYHNFKPIILPTSNDLLYSHDTISNNTNNYTNDSHAISPHVPAGGNYSVYHRDHPTFPVEDKVK
jgi:hypothetical protein